MSILAKKTKTPR